MSQGKKVAFYTLGCKLNFSETSTIGRTFKEVGFETVKTTEKANIYVINTCSVTDQADKKCRQAIKKIIKTNPNAFVVVIGCYAQLKPKEISRKLNYKTSHVSVMLFQLQKKELVKCLI